MNAYSNEMYEAWLSWKVDEFLTAKSVNLLETTVRVLSPLVREGKSPSPIAQGK